MACQRSQTSGCSTLLAKARAFRGVEVVTCSGATTASITAQLASADVGPNTRSVTVTVGGNDIGWSQTLGHGLCGSGSDWINGVQFSGAYPLPQSLHPNVSSEKAYAGRVLLTSWLN